MFKRAHDTCATCGCKGAPIGTLQDTFNVCGIHGVAFYRECAECHQRHLENDTKRISVTVRHTYTWKPDKPLTK